VARKKNKIPIAFEAVEHDYLTPKVKSRVDLHRINKHIAGYDLRYYFEFTQRKVYSYISTTSLIRAVLPKGAAYEFWLQNKGPKANEIRAQRASYGSVLHAECFRPIIRKVPYDLDWLVQKAVDGKGRKLKYSNFQSLFPIEYRDICPQWYYAFSRSLLSIWQFMTDRVIEVYAVEIPLRSRKWGFAGTVDLACIITWNGKKVFAIIDLKSNFFTLFDKRDKEKIVFDDYKMQLEMSRILWEENFGIPKDEDGNEYPVMLFHLSPKAWKGTNRSGEKIPPTYLFDNLTDPEKNKFRRTTKHKRTTISMMECYFLIADMTNLPKPPTTVVGVEGMIENVFELNYEKHIIQTLL
jgi:hypothetical protein